MGKSSGGGNTTTVQKADPWEGVQPALRELYAAALKNFQGPAPQFWPGSVVAQRSPLEEQGISSLTGLLSTQNPLVTNAMGMADRTMAGDYWRMNPSVPGLMGIASNPYTGNMDRSAMGPLMNIGNQNFSDFLMGIPGMGSLANTASGAMLNANPYVDAMFKRASSGVGRQFSDRVMPGIASMYSAAGRYGSEAMGQGLGQAQQEYGRTLDDLATQIYGGNYANERQLMQQASSLFGNMGLAHQQARIGALGQYGQQAAQEGGLKLGAQNSLIGALSDIGQQYGRERAFMQDTLSRAPGLADYPIQNAARLLGLGQADTARWQSELNNQIARFNFEQQSPQQQLAFLSSILNGSPMGSITTQSGPGGSSTFGNMLGGALMGGQLLPWLGSTGMLGSTAAASGMMGGAGINALGGLGLGPLGLIGGAILGGLFG